MDIGDEVVYKGQVYYVVSPPFWGIMEIAPTLHGAGSIMVLEEMLDTDQVLDV